MNLSAFDQTKKRECTYEGEATRLANFLRAKPASMFINSDGIRVDVPARRGFDCETADFSTMVNYLGDPRIKKSDSLITYVHRIMAVRFPDEYAQNRDKIHKRFKIEYEMIQSNAKNDAAWLGQVGFTNMIRQDGSLSRPTSEVNVSKHDIVQIKRKLA